MSVQKFIYWRSDVAPKGGKMFANVHMLVGYNQGSIVDFLNMGKEIRKIIPDVKLADLTCGKVTKSSMYKGFTILTWSGYLDFGGYPGWYQTAGNMEYYW